MSTRNPPRHLPTLTEVVDPNTLANASYVPMPAPASAAPVAEPAPAADNAMLQQAMPDRHLLAQQVIQLVRPQLENELRSMAQELFEAQFSSLLPSLHLHIEEAVREAIELALPESPQA